MIIDALAHIHPDPKSFGAKYDLSPEHLIHNLDNSLVDRAIVTAIEGENNYCTPTTYIIDMVEKYPDHLIGFASVNPITNPNAVADFEKYVTEYGMRGLKLHPRHQGLSADDERIVPVVEKAAELGVPVTMCGSLWKHAPLRNQQPINVDVLAKRVPEAKIIIAHGGGFKFMDAFVVAVANDNVYLETSISMKYFAETPFEDQYMFTLHKIGAHRVIFGSDHPEDPTALCYERSVEMINRHGFDGDAECKIFGENIRSLIGL